MIFRYESHKNIRARNGTVKFKVCNPLRPDDTYPHRWSGIPQDSKIHGANMGPTRGRQDPGGPHVGHVNLAFWDWLVACSVPIDRSFRDRWSLRAYGYVKLTLYRYRGVLEAWFSDNMYHPDCWLHAIRNNEVCLNVSIKDPERRQRSKRMVRGPELLKKIHVKIHINQWFSKMVSDWLAALLPADPVPGLKFFDN